QPLRPSLVLSIKSLDGQVLQAGAAETNRTVLSAPLAYLVHDILADDAARSDSLGASNPLEFSRPAAAKAGRTEDGSQVWTVGYTPQRLALTWVGLSGGSSARLDVRMAAGLWNAVLQAASQDLPAEGWSEPAGISHVPVCDPSGLLPTPACPNIAGEIFLKGSEPTAPDNLYRVVQLNRETGRLATVFTPPAMIEEKTFFVPPPEGQAWAEKAGIPQAPLVYDAIQLPDASPEVNITAPQAFAHVRGQVSLNGTAAGEGFASYRLEVGAGLNPQTWLQVGEEGKSPVRGGALATWDTRGQDGLYALRLQVVRQDNRVDSAIIQVTVDNTPPRLQVVSPSPGQVLPASSGATITLQAQAEDHIGVTRLEWYLDGRLAGAREAAPFTLPWQAIPGKHSLVVKAYDAAGNQVETGPLRFEIQ
ncbi:MAG TPA: Ig-like domain-containing protein, partial [Anaerolineales bacterium]